MTIPSLVGVTDTDDLYGNVLTRNQDTGVLMPRRDAAPDVILVVGQSNAAGNGHPIRSRTSSQPHLVEWWHSGRDSDKGTVTPLVEPTSRAYDGSKGTSPGVEFARCWAAWHRTRTVVVPAAWGGTGLISAGARWQETGDLYLAAVREAQDAISATGGRLAAIVWCQGENDSVSGVSDAAGSGYSTVAARVLDAMRTTLGNPTALVAVGSMSPDWVALGKGTAATIQAALASLPSKLSQCVFAYGGFGTGAEGAAADAGIHYNALGTVQLGRALWAAYRRLLDPSLPPGRPAAPGLTPTASGCTVRWSPSVGGTAYDCRWRTTGDWQSATVSGTTATITAGSDTLVEVQVRARSGAAASAWSQSTLTAPILGTATLLLDASGPGAEHTGQVLEQPIGAGRTAGQVAGMTAPRMDREAGIGDAAAMYFDGGDFIGGPVLAVSDLANAAGQFSVIALAQADAAHDGSFFGWRNSSISIGNLGVQADGRAVAVGFNASNVDVAAKAAIDVTRPHFYAMDRWGNGVTLHIDGVEVASGSDNAPRTTGSVQPLIGAAYRSDINAVSIVQGWRGKLAFLMVVPYVASSAQKASVYAYLRARYNLPL